MIGAWKECKVYFCIQDWNRSLSFYLCGEYEEGSIFGIKFEEEGAACHENIRVLLYVRVELEHGPKQSFVNFTLIGQWGMLAKIVIFLVFGGNRPHL